MIKTTDIGSFGSKGSVLDSKHKAIVIDNKDPEYKRRIKVKIPGIFESEAPIWFSPEIGVGFGDSKDAQRVEIPDVGSEVIVKFSNGDIHSGFYTSNWSLNPVPDEFKEDYPNSHGFKDSSGTLLVINKAKKTFKFEHASGFSFNIDSEGQWTLKSPKGGVVDVGALLEMMAEEAKFKIPDSKFEGEVSDSTRKMSEDRAIYNEHNHQESIGTASSLPLRSQ